MAFLKTARQKEAIQLLGSRATHVMLEGGSRSGKTAIIIFAIILRAIAAPGSRHCILRYRFNHVKTSIWLDTLPKVLALCCPAVCKPIPNSSDYYYHFPNGSEIWVGGLDQSDRVEKILGNEYATLFFNETSQLTYDAVSTALSRLAQRTGLPLKAYYDQNPPSKRHWTYSLFHLHRNPEDNTMLEAPEDYVSMQMHPRDNEANLAPGYIDKILSKLSARKRRRFLDGEYGDDVEGALWTSEVLNSTRVQRRPMDMERIIVGVDPAVTSKSTSDDTGIITVGLRAGHVYVWRDDTCKATPLGWARKAIGAYTEEDADKVVGEVNNGGDLVESNLRQVDTHVSYKAVHATRGKYIRAEPVGNLWEQGKGHIVGSMPDLEDELVTWTPNGDEASPNRLDAMVWAITELIGKRKLAGVWGSEESRGERTSKRRRRTTMKRIR